MLAGGTKSGYTFAYTTGATDTNGNICVLHADGDADQHRHNGPARILHRPVGRDPRQRDGCGHRQQHAAQLNGELRYAHLPRGAERLPFFIFRARALAAFMASR